MSATYDNTSNPVSDAISNGTSFCKWANWGLQSRRKPVLTTCSWLPHKVAGMTKSKRISCILSCFLHVFSAIALLNSKLPFPYKLKNKTACRQDLCLFYVFLCNVGKIPWRREGKGSPLQYSGLENSIDWKVHGVTKSRTRLSDFHFHFCNFKSNARQW